MPSASMHIRLRLDGRALRAWHLDLLGQLSRRPGVTVDADARPGPASLSSAGEALFRFEARAHRSAGNGLSDRFEAIGLSPWPMSPQSADLVIDLCGDAGQGTGIWQLSYDGVVGEAALFAAVHAGRSPLAELREDGRLIVAGRLGTEAPGIVRAAFEDAQARTTTLVLAALDGATTMTPEAEVRASRSTPPFTTANLVGAIAGRVAGTTARRLYKLAYHTPQWRVGWRRVTGPDVIDLKAHPPGGWIDLPDDSQRFYADPFPIEVEGRVTLFVEDYPHATGKGIISAVSFDEAGPLGIPQPVLELPYHLSYPFVFARDGTVWMIPESCAAGTIDLFRATAFPGGWVKEATLVADVVASDATLLEHGGLWWMFATVRANGGSHSDALHLWSAADFRGPWHPHPRNPVLIDNAAARPAGRIVFRDGALWRPVQDCRREYGAALGLARILQLDDAGFDQSVETVLHAGPAWRGTRLHTLNRAGPFEFIDGSSHAFRRSPGR